MGEYDRTLKRLMSHFAADYVRFALRKEQLTVERLEIEETARELPSLSREVDFAARVQVDGEEAILLLEFQTRWETDVPARMVGYSWRLHERYGLGVYPVVLVLRPGGRLVEEWVMRAWEEEIHRFHFRVVPVWEVDPGSVLEQKMVGLYPLLPLMNWEEPDATAVLQETEERVLSEIEGREERADAYVALRVLSGIRHPLELVQRVLQRREIMLESPVYREILEEGRTEGREERLRTDILEVLAVRFERVPADLEAQVDQVRGQKMLEVLHRRAVVVESLEAFAQELKRISS